MFLACPRMKIRRKNSLVQKKIKVGTKYIQAYLIPFFEKNLIILLGKKGYVMCGYLDLVVAEKFHDPAIRIVGVSTIKEALESVVFDCTSEAEKLGVYKNQPIKQVLKLIA